MSICSRFLFGGAALFGLVMFAGLVRSFWPFTVDDTFISLRYAKHLAEGLGPTWNPGGERVEGYTAALWVALMAVPHALGVDALVFAKSLGVVCTIGATAMSALLAFELTRGFTPAARRLAALFPFAFSAAYWPLALHAITGMETALAALLLAAFVMVSVRYARLPTPRRGRSLALLALACTLTRPEVFLVCVVTLSLQALALPRAERGLLARAVATYYVLPGALYFVARYAYFGRLLPLPFYVKATGQPGLSGLDEVRRFFAVFFWPLPHLGLLALLGSIRMRRLYPALVGLASLALFFLFPAHIMGYEGRYLHPIVPVLSAMMGVGVARLASPLLTRSARFGPARRLGGELGLVLAVGLAITTVRFPFHEAEARERWVAYGDGLRRAHVALAERLRAARLQVVRPKVALLDVGAVAYYSEWFTIDTYGLNNARAALSRRKDGEHVFAHEPELLVVVSKQPARYDAVFDYEQQLYDMAQSRGYARVATYRFLPNYHLLVLARPGSPLRETLATSQ